MRHYTKLDQVSYDESNDTLLVGSQNGEETPTLWFGREGMYLSVSASAGPLEISLRPRFRDLSASLTRLTPTERLTVMRLVGTGQAHLELGLSTEQELLLRTVIVADATGHVAMNFILMPNVVQALFEWLKVENAHITG